MAYKRLSSVLKRIEGAPNIAQEYQKAIEDQLKRGVIETTQCNPDMQEHFLPHHAVFNKGKIRLVYDASAHPKGLPSLNQSLFRGPVLLPNLINLLLRFRATKIPVLADIERAFHQIALIESDREFCKFLWVKNLDQPLSPSNMAVYRFKRIAFGIISSPYILAAVIRHHLSKEQTDIANEIKENIYVDNVLLECDSVEEALIKCKTAKQIFSTAKMNLREFCTHERAVSDQISPEDRLEQDIPRVLGINWNLQRDTLQIKFPPLSKPITRRTVLGTISSCFDPMGLVGPCLLPAKAFFQHLWTLDNFEWDTVLPPDESRNWERVTSDWSTEISIPRLVLQGNSLTVQIHTFTDASDFAFGTAVYLRSESREDGRITTSLVFSKNRLRPLKANSKLTIPRLELLGILSGVRASKFVQRELQREIDKTFIWSDSTIALSWLKETDHQPVFIANRTKEIRTLTNCEFRYVNTTENPADLVTRGKSPSELQSNHLWWHGPTWLSKPEIGWPTGLSLEFNTTDSTDESAITNTLVNTEGKAETPKADDLIEFKRFNSWDKIRRTTIWVLRFLQSIFIKSGREPSLFIKDRRPELLSISQATSRENTAFSANDYLTAGCLLIKIAQQQNITEIERYPLETDQNGLLLLKTRIAQQIERPTLARPIILPRSSHLKFLIISDIHQELTHGGIDVTLTEFLVKYWTPNARKTVKTVIRTCLKCERMRAYKYSLPQFPPYPNDRVFRKMIFESVGLDYAGPSSVRINGIITKFYLLLFCCLTTRAIHLEITLSQSAEAFMNAFQRFISRRGKPKRVISDNAPSFILADKTIDFLINEPSNELAKKGIDWTFIPAYSPWAGGMYERLIGITKQLFQRTLGKEILHFDDLITFTAKVEATLNLRPISNVSDEKDGFLPLRPADLLIPKIELNLPTDRLLEEIPFRPDSHEKLAEIYIATDRAHEFFWERWSKEYLLILRSRTQTAHKGKRLENHSAPRIGEIVIVEEKYTPRNLWPMGRIVKLGGKPGATRSVEIQMQNGNTVTRPVNSVCPLEITQTEQEAKVTEPAPLIAQETYAREPKTNVGHRMITRSKSRALVSTLLNVVLFIFCFSFTYGSPINNMTCTKCQISCTRTGVTVISPSEFANLELCCAGNCLIKPHAPKVDYELPHELLVVDYHCQITLADNQDRIYQKEKTCPAHDECSLIDCTICWDRITNPTCAPVNSGILIGSGLLFILLFLSWIITHVKIVFAAFQFIFAIFSALFRTPIRALRAYDFSSRSQHEAEDYLMSEYNSRRINRERNRRWRINRLYRNGLLAILAFILLPRVYGSNEIIAVTAKNSDCRRTLNGTQCTIKSSVSLTILPANQKTSILVRNERGLALGTFSIVLERLTLNCLPKSVAWLRSYRVLTASAKRCARAGLCFGNHCQSVRPTTNIPELGEANFFPGNTFCIDSPGFWGIGCGLPADGCLYYRFYAKPTSDAAYELIDCPTWQFKIKVHLELQTGTNVESSDLILHPGQTKKWGTQIGAIALSTNPTALPPLPILTKRFILSSYLSAAITESIPLDLFCTDEDAARSFNCSLYRETCHDCYPDHETGTVECFCRDLDMESILSDSSNRLPLSLPNLQIMNFQNEIFAETEYTPIHTLVQFENVELALETEDSHCFITAESLIGCYRCLTGAQAKFTCTTDYGSALASVKCIGTHLFSARCSENGTTQSVILAFNWAQINVDCRVECPAGFSQFTLNGELKYIPAVINFTMLRDLMIIGLQAEN
uniref:Integrase catalytic domain-containing protein n=1 Tax=Meloidogyne enterolobii TaxID=390850 RepID=A0A6V7VR52_MELEN|nr:unnamed protein product [Meloidogyne enterolobii]